jgi:hypothetical protein
MKIDGSEFGAVTIDGTTYAHDVIIRLSGAVEKRKKKLSKKYYGTSHVISKDEAKLSLRERLWPPRHRHWPWGQRASVAGSQRLLQEEGVRSHLAADAEGHQIVQPGQGSQDRAYPRDVLKRSRSVVLALDALEIVQAPMLFVVLRTAAGSRV